MTKLKLGAIPDDKPVKLSVELPAAVHGDLLDFAEVLGAETNQPIAPEKLIPHMLARFMATDRGFANARRNLRETGITMGAKPPTPPKGGIVVLRHPG